MTSKLTTQSPEILRRSLLAGGGAAIVASLRAEAAAVERTVQARLDDCFRVTDFGAVGNNVDDSLAAFNACRDAAIASQSGRATIHIPYGEYRLSNTFDPGKCSVICDEGSFISPAGVFGGSALVEISAVATGTRLWWHGGRVNTLDDTIIGISCLDFERTFDKIWFENGFEGLLAGNHSVRATGCRFNGAAVGLRARNATGGSEAFALQCFGNFFVQNGTGLQVDDGSATAIIGNSFQEATVYEANFRGTTETQGITFLANYLEATNDIPLVRVGGVGSGQPGYGNAVTPFVAIGNQMVGRVANTNTVGFDIANGGPCIIDGNWFSALDSCIANRGFSTGSFKYNHLTLNVGSFNSGPNQVSGWDIRGNAGLKAVEGGQAQIDNGTNSVVVNHGLDFIPTHVFLEPNGRLTDTPWVESKNATSFTIRTAGNQTADRLISWRAVFGGLD